MTLSDIKDLYTHILQKYENLQIQYEYMKTNKDNQITLLQDDLQTLKKQNKDSCQQIISLKTQLRDLKIEQLGLGKDVQEPEQELNQITVAECINIVE
ncbi:hypothetical protein SS50377_23016 [Spironucleus salmonicida]|uniref:Uncharacterized protein n=1 Tax=Spironucleus salmonicida TaxID=348837 RepID=V6LSE9_9EUKA|nr:hypothetical protein SS50377_23016 [Spironucleus salmonicida]|eukprot:EST47597.1 Hypothetical protein SS50377_12289 [Spironucleus salmonicida]